MDVVVITGTNFQSKTLEASRMVNVAQCGWIDGNTELQTFINYFDFCFNKYNDFVFDGNISHDVRHRLKVKALLQQMYFALKNSSSLFFYSTKRVGVVITCMPQDKEFWWYDMPSDFKITFIELMDDS